MKLALDLPLVAGFQSSLLLSYSWPWSKWTLLAGMENLLHYVATHHFLPWQKLFINLDTDTAQNWAKTSRVDSPGNHYQLIVVIKTVPASFVFMVCTLQLTFDIFTTIWIFVAFDNVALGHIVILSFFLTPMGKTLFLPNSLSSQGAWIVFYTTL